MREMILKKALTMFVEDGFKTVTMDDIAGALGISKKTIYQHFSSKNVIVSETVEYVYNKAADEVKRVVSKDYNAIEEHFEVRNSLAQIFNLNVKSSNIHQFKKYYPKMAEAVNKKRYAVYQSTILGNLNRGIEQGMYRKEIDVNLIGQFFFITSSNLFNSEMFDLKKSYSLDEIQLSNLEYHIRAISTPKGLEVLENILKKLN